MTLSFISKCWVPCGAIVNQGGLKSTVTPFGGNTAHTYVSDLFPTFLTLLCTDRDPTSPDTVTEGRFRSDGNAKDDGVVHDPPVAVLIAAGSMLGREQRKLM